MAVFIIGLMVDPLNSYQKIFNRPRTKLDDVAIVYISVAGYLLINMLFIIGYALGDRIPRKTVSHDLVLMQLFVLINNLQLRTLRNDEV